MTRRSVVVGGLAFAFVVAALVIAAPLSSAQETQTWSGSAAFLAGTLLDTNITTSGSLTLASHPVAWSKYAGNPVLRPGPGWDSGWTLAPDILYEGGLYKMWYQGCSGSCDIGYATSVDGITWTPYSGNPVLTANASSWDTTLGNPHVVHDASGYHLWYAGDGPLAIRIGYATSPDGLHWTKYGTWPVFNGSLPWDTAAVTGPAVIRSGSLYIMYFSGHPGTYDYSMGRATSTDGVHWTEYAGNPVMTYTEPWEQTRVHPSYFSFGSSGYDLYYSAGAPGGIGGVGHATSPDGINWTKDSANPVLTIGSAGSWDGSAVGSPFLATIGGQVRMYYTGYNTTVTPSVLQIGYAVQSPGGVGFAPVGTWVSAVFDSGQANTTWASLTWVAATPANTAVGAAIQVGNTSSPDLSWTLSPPSVASPTTLSLPKARYARVLVALVSSDGLSTPTVASVTVTFVRPVPTSSASSYWGLGLLGVLLLVGLVAAIVVAVVVGLALTKRPPYPAPASQPATRPSTCPRCGANLPPVNRFCGACGMPVARPPGPPPTGP